VIVTQYANIGRIFAYYCVSSEKFTVSVFLFFVLQYKINIGLKKW